MNWAFYTSVLATLVMMAGFGHIIIEEHDWRQPRTLSELAAAQDHLLRRFRYVLWVGLTLLSLVMYLHIIPRSTLSGLLFFAWTLAAVGCLLLSVLPAKGRTRGSHEASAKLMASGLGGVAFLFLADLRGGYFVAGLVVAVIMTLLAWATVLDPRRFLVYEWPFLHLSNIAIIIMVLFLGSG